MMNHEQTQASATAAPYKVAINWDHESRPLQSDVIAVRFSAYSSCFELNDRLVTQTLVDESY